VGTKGKLPPKSVPRRACGADCAPRVRSGDVVFDPFAGIGTTLAIAEALDRKPLGFELNQEYIDYYQEHVRPTALEEVGSVQSTLQDEQSVLQKKIYTLRIHKYAYKLYRELVRGKQ